MTVSDALEANGSQMAIAGAESVPDESTRLARLRARVGVSSMARCKAMNCQERIDGNYGGTFCSGHRRSLRLMTRFSDALFEFFDVGEDAIRPGTRFDANVHDAGELISEAMGLLVGCLFRNNDIEVNPHPIEVGSFHKDNARLRWRVNFWFKVVER